MPMDDELRYFCPYCGEEIVTPYDYSQGSFQEYVEDCPVCCSPVILRIERLDSGALHCEALAE